MGRRCEAPVGVECEIVDGEHGEGWDASGPQDRRRPGIVGVQGPVIDADAVEGRLVQLDQDQIIESRAVGVTGARNEIEVVGGVVSTSGT